MELVPSLVQAGTVASLSVQPVPDFDSSAQLIGSVSYWQCWTGSEWMDTHVLERTPGGSYRTAPLDPVTPPTIEAVAYPLPEVFTIEIPDVRTGTYRIRDYVQISPDVSVEGFVMVEVGGG